jgi:hypothetical protein
MTFSTTLVHMFTYVFILKVTWFNFRQQFNLCEIQLLTKEMCLEKIV